MGHRKCLVCNEAPSKYKCPICLVPYCSLVCFKKHKEVPCVKPVSPEDHSTAPHGLLVDRPISIGRLPVERPISIENENGLVEKSQLEAIASSSEIRSALNDGSLQQLIYAINSSPDPKTELDKAMEVEAFGIFSSKILSTINPSPNPGE